MPPPLRLAVFVPDLEDRPDRRTMVDVANAARRRGIAVDVIAPMGGGPLRAALDPGVGQIDLAKRHTATAPLALARILAERRPAALVAAGTLPGAVAVAAARLARTGARVVVVDGRRPSPLVRRVYARAGAVLADGGAEGVLGAALSPPRPPPPPPPPG